MKFFVYGRLKSDERKAHLIPFAKSEPYRLYGFKVLVRPDGAAALMRGKAKDYIDGELREVRYPHIPIIGWVLGKLLLRSLDLNEGVPWGVYERIQIKDFWVYLQKRRFPKKDAKVVRKWTEGALVN